VLGAGPAGLGAAFALTKRPSFDVTVIDRAPVVGGNAGSFEIAGLRVDYGSHRLHPSCEPSIMADIQSLLGSDLLDRPRHGRIRIRGHWVHFPLKPVDLVAHLPFSFASGVVLDLARKVTSSKPTEETFENLLERGLGRTICRDFYFPYARKIWGVDPSELDAEQARRRVSAGSLGKMIRKVLNAVPGFKPKGAGRFFYPRKGFGQISEAFGAAAEKQGATLRLKSAVTQLNAESGAVTSVSCRDDQGEVTLPSRQVLSTIPITYLARALSPGAPQAVLDAVAALRFRAMILIYLVLETEQFTEFDAHYFPDAEIGITRLSEPKNYGLATLPGHTVLCAELPCSQQDAVWSASDEQLGELMKSALATAGIPVRARVKQVAARRLPQAYPIYARGYQPNFDLIDQWVGTIPGLLTFGRQGLFAHDNTHHALAMAYAVNDCLDDSGNLNAGRWRDYRIEFQKHVVED
jgi:protoporphyrinogen oxidase